MTALSPTHVLRKYAHALQIASPREWDAFVSCFGAYADEVTVAVTRAEQFEILCCQGRAQAFLHLLDIFRHCNPPPPPPPPTPPPSP